MWWLLILSLTAFAQDEIDLEAVRILGDQLPTTNALQVDEEIEQRSHKLRYRPPYRNVTLASILKSGTEYGYVKEGTYLTRIKDNKAIELHEPFYGKFFRLQDEHGFKYIQNNDGSCVYKIRSQFFTSVQEDIALYVPPLKYTPAPVNITRADYDEKLKLVPEVSFYAGTVQGSYMQDLFNDEKARKGFTTQYGLHLATRWNLPVKVGAVVHYEKTDYELRDSGKVNYSAISFGPQFKSKDLDVYGSPWRLQAQFRVSPLARANAQTSRGDISFKFNSSDLLLSVERPIENRIGEFVLGFFFQSQWLNIKDQPEIVKIDASNQTNRSFGLSFSQVFQ